jgi:hypothetical protein
MSFNLFHERERKSGLSGDVKLWAIKITAALRLMVDVLLRSENALKLKD